MAETSSAPANSWWQRANRVLTSVRVTTFNILFVLLVVLIVVGLARSCSTTSIESGSALLINPAGVVVEQRSSVDPMQLLVGGAPNQEVVIEELIYAVNHAAEDARITAITLRLEDLLQISPVHAEMLGDALKNASAAGKPVTAYGDYFTQAQYLLASHADAVYLHHMGELLITGYASYSLYFKDLLDKLKVNIHTYKVGDFKSAVEPFTATSMSDAARLANRELIDARWQRYAEVVGANRQMGANALQTFADTLDAQMVNARGDAAAVAIEAHLVDELMDADQFNARMVDQVGSDEEGNYQAISFDAYYAEVAPLPIEGSGEIALITGRGPIVDGDGQGALIASRTTRALIREARLDDRVRAIVFRVDSPGGSAFASEVIRQELELAQLAGKPVVISMGPVAASGGYWVSATADHIVAHPATITGSIGVFSLFPTLENSLAEVGVGRDGVGTTALSGGLDVTGGISPPMQRVLQASVGKIYDQFLALVARGRNLSLDRVQEIAQGRVWVGSTALDIGLVDSLGDTQTAIDKAAELADLTSYDVWPYSPPEDPRNALLKSMLSFAGLTPADEPPLAQLFGALRTPLETWTRLRDPRHTYVLCEVCLTLPSQ